MCCICEKGTQFSCRRPRSLHGSQWALDVAVIRFDAVIEAAQIIRKGQVLGITRPNLHGQAWVFAALLGIKWLPSAA